MKFVISRTSDSGQPCKEAFSGKGIRIDERTTDDPAKIVAYGGKTEWWYGDGKNHRVENGHIKRDIEHTFWFIEIATLDDLLKFIGEYGQIVIGPCYYNSDYIEIEIYDDYRE